MTTVWNTVSDMRDTEIGGEVTLGQILDALDNPAVEKYRDTEILKSYTVGEVAEILNSAEQYLHLREKEVAHPFTLREIANAILTDDHLKEIRDLELLEGKNGKPGTTAGDVLTKLVNNKKLAALLDRELGKTLTLGQVNHPENDRGKRDGFPRRGECEGVHPEQDSRSCLQGRICENTGKRDPELADAVPVYRGFCPAGDCRTGAD